MKKSCFALLLTLVVCAVLPSCKRGKDKLKPVKVVEQEIVTDVDVDVFTVKEPAELNYKEAAEVA